ncbi:MAG: 50S ribosomal protein L22 [Deltaproteobacteria bacterium]|jgi:large subunit ribosomal protein L22|nr:50S ribosomal protein L22 [Deltaproteobacteria bacterium]
MSERAHKKRHERKVDKAIERKRVIRCVKRFQRACPDKVRIVARTVIGMKVGDATNYLKFGITKASRVLGLCLKSAIDNAIMVFGKEVDDLFVKGIMVDRGPMLKRIHPVSHGMAKHILKRTCHVTVVVSDKG